MSSEVPNLFQLDDVEKRRNYVCYTIIRIPLGPIKYVLRFCERFMFKSHHSGLFVLFAFPRSLLLLIIIPTTEINLKKSEEWVQQTFIIGKTNNNLLKTKLIKNHRVINYNQICIFCQRLAFAYERFESEIEIKK